MNPSIFIISSPSRAARPALAVQLRHDLAPIDFDGVFFVALASLGAAGAVPDAVAQALGLRPDDDLHAYLASRRLLLVLDNTEHLAGIEEIYRTFYELGYAVRPSPTYADLMTATDEHGVERSYLATEENYAFLMDLESRNLVVPVVGDFGGPMAIRAIAKYLRGNGATITAFYLSNVEESLYQDGKWNAFCHNVATLPLNNSSTFIRSESGVAGGFGRFVSGFVSSLGQITSDIKACMGEK